MTTPIIGIDLGTTNSEVAVVHDGQVHIIDVDGQALLPSVVGLADDGALLVGQTARNQYALRPEQTLRSIKRRMGEDVNIPLGEHLYTPQEISALILRRLKKAAEAFLGIDVTQAVITVPAYFSDAQRQATREAGRLADLDVKRIINEPTAAVLAYEANHDEAKNILVYDLGGGTFDVSVVRLAEDINQVLSSHGNNRLGGDDFDTRIINHLVDHLKSAHQVDPSDNRSAMARIMRAAEAAKVTLSDTPYVRIDEEYLLEHNGQPVHLSLELSRDDYEEMIMPLINDTLEAVHIALEGAKLTVSDLDEVLLVGGATRTPLVQQCLEEMLGIIPRAELDPELCVANGAAIQGALIAGDSVARVLVDVTPYTFGTSALDELDGEPYPYVYVPLIRKNTPIPVTKSETFGTVHDGQEIIEVKVFQGEARDALNNTQIGDFRVEGLDGNASAGNVIVATFTLDINGILEVSAREKSTGLEKRITIENATARFAEDRLKESRDRLKTLIEGDVVEGQAEQRHEVQAKALIEKAERLLDHTSPEDREDLVDCMEAVRDGLNRDETVLAEAVDELSDLIFYLES